MKTENLRKASHLLTAMEKIEHDIYVVSNARELIFRFESDEFQCSVSREDIIESIRPKTLDLLKDRREQILKDIENLH